MKIHSYNLSQSMRTNVLVCVCTLVLLGCSGSSDSVTGNNQSVIDSSANSDTASGVSNDVADTTNTIDTGSGADQSVGNSETETTPLEEGPISVATTRVEFDITVPTYMASDELQVQLSWGDIDLSADWVIGEKWSASESFPANTKNQLLVTFVDRNGGVTLGTFESTFRTSTNTSEVFQISANQFDTSRWDSDSDGVSNFDEMIAGTNFGGDDLLQPVQASLELVQNKTFRISWQAISDAQFYRVLENPDQVSGFTQISDDLDAAASVFDHRVALYEKFNASYIVQSCNAVGCVDSEVMTVSGHLEQAIGYIKASNSDAGDRFGYTVGLSSDGNTLAVGAIGESGAVAGVNADQTDNSDSYTGAVYLFEKLNNVWKQQAYLKADIPDAFYFGHSLSLSGNGKTLAVLESTRNGGIHIYQSDGGNWQQQTYLPSSVLSETEQIDGNLNLSADGNTLIASSEDGVYVFERSDGNWWRETAYITPDNIGERGVGWGFSHRASLSSDGNTLAVSAHVDGSSAIGVDGDINGEPVSQSGAVFVYARRDGAWQQEAYIKASITGKGDNFGDGMTLSGDGNTLAVGASLDTGGAVYVFFRDTGSWQEQGLLKAGNDGEKYDFGRYDMSLSADGSTLAVGLWTETSAALGVNGDQSDDDALYAGAVFMFKRNNGLWQSQAYLKASNTDRAGGRAGFGRSVSLSADGGTLAVGADGEYGAATGINGDQYDGLAQSAGAVYLY